MRADLWRVGRESLLFLNVGVHSGEKSISVTVICDLVLGLGEAKAGTVEAEKELNFNGVPDIAA